MKTLTKIVTVLPVIALFSACATTAPTMSNTADASIAQKMTDTAYDRMAPATYACTDNGKIMAKQSINKKQVMLNATLPKVSWTEQPIILNGGIHGEMASYVNDSNPEAVYAWHMKEDKGIFAIKWANGKEYQVNCHRS